MNKKVLYGAALAIAISAGSVYADEVSELRKQIDTMSQRLEELEKSNVKLEESTQKLEADSVNTEKLAEDAAKKVVPDWVKSLSIKGDIRTRYDNRTVESSTVNDRLRFRARVGLYTDTSKEFFGGIRLASGSSDTATSANQTFDDWASEKDVWIDKAYIGYAPEAVKGLEVMAGKMSKPWIDVDTMFWDGDVNPEGGSVSYSAPVGPVKLFAQLGQFIMEENNGDDLRLTTAQLAGTIDINEKINLQVGGTAYIWRNIKGATPISANGNTVDALGQYASKFEIGQIFSILNIKTDFADFKIYDEFAHNFNAVDSQDSAWLAGIGAKRGKFACSYSYRDEQNNAIVAFFSDSDFAGSQISSGHRINAKYNVTKNFNFGLNYAIANTYADKDDNILLLDAVLKF